MKATTVTVLGFVLSSCSSGSLPPYGTESCRTSGPRVMITTVDNEQLWGGAQIQATQQLDGSSSFGLAVCATNGTSDVWRLSVWAMAPAPEGGQTSTALPLTQSDQITLPVGEANVDGTLLDGYIGSSAPTGLITTSHGTIDGVVGWGDTGATATIHGGFTFDCSTNREDPDFKTTFCKQFIDLAP